MAAPPLILTLALDKPSQAFFDELRRRHFPPERNHLAAHVTLFHALPGEHLAEVEEHVREAAARPPFDVDVTGLRSLGRGVAYVLRSRELLALREALARRWHPWLTPQDSARFAPHITVQNKVSADVAHRLLDELRATFEPRVLRARGLSLWWYRGGPWEQVATVSFGHG